jgi:hypothetical protein
MVRVWGTLFFLKKYQHTTISELESIEEDYLYLKNFFGTKYAQSRFLLSELIYERLSANFRHKAEKMEQYKQQRFKAMAKEIKASKRQDEFFKLLYS